MFPEAELVIRDPVHVRMSSSHPWVRHFGGLLVA